MSAQHWLIYTEQGTEKEVQPPPPKKQQKQNKKNSLQPCLCNSFQKGSEFLHKSLTWGVEGGVNLLKLASRHQSRCRQNDNSRSRECYDTGEEKIDRVGGGDMTNWQKNTFHFRHGNTRQEKLEGATCFRSSGCSWGGFSCLKHLLLCKIHFTSLISKCK